jgi:hypothetical protein
MINFAKRRPNVRDKLLHSEPEMTLGSRAVQITDLSLELQSLTVTAALVTGTYRKGSVRHRPQLSERLNGLLKMLRN